MTRAEHLIHSMLDPRSEVHAAIICDTLSRYSLPLLRLLSDAGTRVRTLDEGERYIDVSAEISRLDIPLDLWPSAPAGLFVVAERTIYLRDISPMTIGHECGHAIDAALGGGAYRSTSDPAIQRLYECSTRFVTPYAASSVDELVAEAFRSYAEINDKNSPWPPVSRARLRACNRDLYRAIAQFWRHPDVLVASKAA